jgi:hypothetical protein
MFFRDHILLPVVIALTATGVGGAFNAQKLNLHNSQGINLWKLQRLRGASVVAAPKRRDDSPGTSGQASQTPLVDEFDAETFVQRLDHFGNTTDATFAQRFWVNKRHYKPRPSAPVIVLDGGETSGEDRLPFLDTGIADILARATGGLAVVLEHRYYGAWVLLIPNWESDCVYTLADTEVLFLRQIHRCSEPLHGFTEVRFASFRFAISGGCATRPACCATD